MEKRQYVYFLLFKYIWRRVETDTQGIPTSRQEEEVNGNSRKGECRVSGKEGDYIVRNWMEVWIGCTSLAGHAALRQDCGLENALYGLWITLTMRIRDYWSYIGPPTQEDVQESMMRVRPAWVSLGRATQGHWTGTGTHTCPLETFRPYGDYADFWDVCLCL